MPLNRYQRLAYRLLGSSVASSAGSNIHLRLSLLKAHVPLRPEVYLGYSYLNMIMAFGSTSLLVGALGGLAAMGAVAVPATLFVFLVPLPLVLAFTTYLLTFVIPDLRASNRARDIDAKLPYALSYAATMASAGMTPDRIFATLAKQPLYGEVASEAAWISRDLQLLGKDLAAALTEAIDRSPSVKFQDFLQGALSTISSGGDLKQYFLSKSEQYVYENRQNQKKFLDNLGVLGESFVTVVVAGPLFLLVLLSVMSTLGGDPRSLLLIGYVLVLVLLPLAQAGFAATIKYVTPEV